MTHPAYVPSDHGVTFRHSGWARNRALIYASLARTGAPDARLQRFRDCGSHAWVLRDANDPNRLRVASTNCHDRHCVPCGNERARCIGANVQKHVGARNHRFVTLTVRSTDLPLSETLDRLFDCFRRLRRTRWWALRVRGGCAFTELTYNPATGLWHPHLHLLVDSDWLDHSELSGAWHNVTGDSFVVHVALVRNTANAVRYCVKYAAKPLPGTILGRADVLDHAVQALAGRRLVHTFGTWRGLKLTAIDDSTIWETVCSLNALIAANAQGEPWAIHLLAKLKESRPCNPAEPTTRAPPHDVDLSLFESPSRRSPSVPCAGTC